jgi:hypothetical protein
VPIFLLVVTKVQQDEGDGRILLGDNTGNGEVMLVPNRFQCDVAFQLDSYIHI